MRNRNYCIILAVLIFILSVPLVANSNPALTDVERVHLRVSYAGTDPNLCDRIETDVKNKIQQLGIEVILPVHLGKEITPAISSNILKVQIDMLDIEPSALSVFGVRTSLESKVSVRRQKRHHLRANIWKVDSPLEIGSTDEISAKVAKTAINHVDIFLEAWLQANPKPVKPADANDTAATAKPIPRETPEKNEYVGSKNSKVFHISDCSSAARILPKNLVKYNSAVQAVSNGKRPCKHCEPQ